DEMLDDERCFEVRHREIFRMLERFRKASDAERLALGQLMRVLERQLPPPRRIAAVLFPDGDALRQPSRYAIVRELQGEDVRQLVPKHRVPAEVAWWPRLRRVHGNHASEARAKRTDDPFEASRADREVIMS